MEYEIIIETLGSEEFQKEIYCEILCNIIKECLSEVNKYEQSNNIFEGLH